MKKYEKHEEISPDTTLKKEKELYLLLYLNVI